MGTIKLQHDHVLKEKDRKHVQLMWTIQEARDASS